MRLLGIDLDYIAQGSRESVSFTASGTGKGLRWDMANTEKLFSLSLCAEGEIELTSVRARFSHTFRKDDRLFLNGYQSWTDSHERTVREKNHSLDRVPKFVVDKFSFSQYGDYTFVPYGKKRGQMHGFSYGYIRREKEYLLLASLCEESGFTILRFDANENTITLEKDCRGHHFTGNYPVFSLAILRGDEDAVFDRYFALLGTPKPRGGRINGYTSWYRHYEEISEEKIAHDLEGFARLEKTPDVFQIDDGYESAVGDWLLVDEKKFPSGMAPAAQKIREAGMLPGLWLAPFAAEKESALVREHPDWLLRGDDGKPVMGGCNWSGFYGLDIYNEDLRAYLREVFDTVLGKWGYGLVKLDFLYAACIVPRRDKTRAQVMFDGMRFLREVCGDALILGCGVPLAAAYGLVDYCRIGCDVALSWDDTFYMRPMHRERASTKNTVLNTVFRRQLDGRAFRNDPDVFLLRDDNLKLDGQQKRILAAVNALFGGVLFTSDDIASYSEEAKETYAQLETLSAKDFVSIETSEKSVKLVYRKNGHEEILEIPR
ncbi:MAG: alpha-galactosidase [Oscillospiraceae bacterium]|nr:alpha-galactosidase [Oscillospiraceae bacterium]